MPNFDLTNKNIVVTGAARGNGLAMSRGLFEAGANVIGIDKVLNEDQEFILRQVDITNEAEVDIFFDIIIKEFGHIHGLINNAGVSIGSDQPYSNMDSYFSTIEVNLNAVFYLTSMLCEHMAQRGGGSIVNITSLGAHQGFPQNPSYQISKAGLQQLTRAFACDWGVKGIRLNNLCPGYIKTSMTQGSFDDPELHKQRLDRTMLNRWGKSEDLIGAAIFLLSEASSYITGSTIFVDGGWTAKGF